MIREIQAKTILTSVKQPDTWFGLRYNFNLYRGCGHQCIYCDSRSECYGIEDFRETLVKVNGPELLRDELARKRIKGVIGTGSMSDPYNPAEARYNLMSRVLKEIEVHGFGVHVITKSDLVLKDLETLKAIGSASVSFTVTAYDDDLALRLEPGAPPPSRRFSAMKSLSAAGINTGVTMMPVLPFITDNRENIAAIAAGTKEAGGTYIIPAFGMTLRDRQRAYYYQQLDTHFPGLSDEYRTAFGGRYSCSCVNADGLRRFLQELCRDYGLATRFTAPAMEPRQGRLDLDPGR